MYNLIIILLDRTKLYEMKYNIFKKKLSKLGST